MENINVTSNANVRYCQVVETTFEQKVEMYMQCDKKTLAEMLAMRDTIDEKNKQVTEHEYAPYSPDKSALPYWYNKCKSWSDCINPNYDCINCPLRSGMPLNKKNEVYSQSSMTINEYSGCVDCPMADHSNTKIENGVKYACDYKCQADAKTE